MDTTPQVVTEPSLKRTLRRLGLLVGAPTLRALAPLFGFQRRYLVGRHFDSHLSGWRMLVLSVLMQKLLGFNRACPFPFSSQSRISGWDRIEFHPDDFNNFWHFGCYFQAIGAKIVIGRGTWIAPNVGIITTNHDPADLDRHRPGKDVVIGERCWIGMNSVILPGVTLGPNTVVGAGSVVTKSFPDGNCVIAGSPARLVRQGVGR